MKVHQTSIHIFRRDLRLEDNTALMAALSQSARVIPVFIFDPEQQNHPYKGNNSFEFMLNSLVALNEKLGERSAHLYLFSGDLQVVLDDLFAKVETGAVYVNRDYTPFNRERDKKISELCAAREIEFNSYADALLNEPEEVLKDNGSPYSVFTPFMRKAKMKGVPEPVHNLYTNYYTEEINTKSRLENPLSMLADHNPDLLIKGGRKEGLNLLENLGQLGRYNETRNLPAVQGTSLLSAHHKFGTVSVRETHQRVLLEFGSDHALINELYWRDFFTHIVWHFPHVLGNPFHSKYNNIVWENDKDKFQRWCYGQTGFPIVDAGMRELVTSGYMHNRVRMIAASFLCKDLHIDWQWGERFFAHHLIDYDPAVNNGNWQWAASTGCDAQPYFRIFNPWSQQKKFDPECLYIKKWIPELNQLDAREIHKLEDNDFSNGKYVRPMVQHKVEAEYSKQIFKNL